MVQAQPKGKQQSASELQARYQNIVREVHNLPQNLLADLLHEIAEMMRGRAAEVNGNKVEAATNRHRQRNGSNRAAAPVPNVQAESAEDAEDEQLSGFELVIAQGGPMAEVARMLMRDHLTDEERQQMKQMAYEAWRAMPPSNVPPPTDEEIEQMRHERRMKKYGR